MSDEIWKPVLGYEGFYEVSSIGRVRSLDRWVERPPQGTRLVRGRVLKQTVQVGRDFGYPYIKVCVNGVSKTKRVHTLVCEAFHGPRPAGMQVCHNDGTRTNNTVGNLRWGTPSENQLDRIDHGTSSIGERNPNARLSEPDVR